MGVSGDFFKLRAVKAQLAALADRFDGDAVRIDRNVFNPARIWKLYGTLARKGDSVPRLGRVHRVSRVLYLPDLREEESPCAAG